MPLLEHKWFRSHSGIGLPWKIDCDFLSDADIDCIAQIIYNRLPYSQVIGIPTGGMRLANALHRCQNRLLFPEHYRDQPICIADDVVTTGASLDEYRKLLKEKQPCFGVAIFARGPTPSWIWPIFTVNAWAQRPEPHIS